MTLPQADASTFVARAELERQAQDVYRGVGRNPSAPRPFEPGGSLDLLPGDPTSLRATRQGDPG